MKIQNFTMCDNKEQRLQVEHIHLTNSVYKTRIDYSMNIMCPK